MTESTANRYAATLFLFALATSGAFYFAPSLAWWVSGGIAIVGLVLVGIPHGALDVVTHSFRNNTTTSWVYIAKYLAAIGLVLMGWLFMPGITLIGFLLLSAWHFGQADFELWDVKRGEMIWGVFVLSMILGWHLDEVQSILLPIGVSEVVLSGSTRRFLLDRDYHNCRMDLGTGLCHSSAKNPMDLESIDVGHHSIFTCADGIHDFLRWATQHSRLVTPQKWPKNEQSTALDESCAIPPRGLGNHHWRHIFVRVQ